MNHKPQPPQPHHHPAPRVLFVCKLRTSEDPNTGYSTGGLSSGLRNSARFVAAMLEQNGVAAEVVEVQDNNSVDRELARFRPTLCILEAVWITPAKFAELLPLHPTVKFMIRVHSGTPFAVSEGNYFDWMLRYLDYGPQMLLNANSHEMFSTLNQLLSAKYSGHQDLDGNDVDVAARLSHLPNYYPVSECGPRPHAHKPHVDIGCFGATRPLKNQVLQAVAAMRFADNIGKPLRFHINASRVESNGGPVLKNIRSVFAAQTKHQLVEHPWMEHAEFLKEVDQMDIGMQVSFSETYNIVVADHVARNVPVVVSHEVQWVDRQYQAESTNVAQIVELLELVYRDPHTAAVKNREHLERYSQISQQMWLGFIHSL